MSRRKNAKNKESFDEAQDRQEPGSTEQGAGNLPGGGSFAIFFLSGVVEDT
jgi:hypothetical protein